MSRGVSGGEKGDMPEEKRVLLVLTPWASPYFPGLSVALLRSILIREGIACDIFYANLLLSKVTGGNPIYEDSLAKGSYAELAFTPFYFDTNRNDAAERLLEAFHFLSPPGEAGLRLWTRLFEHVEEFLDECMTRVPWELYDIVGFSVMFQQTVSSLALARRIKRAYPAMSIVFGGPSCAAPMGSELLRSFPEIDYVVAGEGDHIIAPLIREIRRDSGNAIMTPGVLYRKGGRTTPSLTTSRNAIGVAEPSIPQPVFDLDSLPIPDYTPYFEQAEDLGLSHFDPFLYIENSRGCWWGEKHHCTFCGIDDALMKYRVKSEDRILDEILTLSERYRRTSFLTADNILDHRFYATLLPRLKALRDGQAYDLTFFFELKSNLNRERVRLLWEAGVTQVQPGIESFSDGLLALMDKGASGIQQLYTLKCLAEFGIEPVWNIIYMNPQERAEHYRPMIDMIPFMHHLPPLRRQNEVEMLLQRFNLYFERPEKYGISDIRPQEFYRELFPRDDINFKDLAYFFDYDRGPMLNDDALQAAHAELAEALEEWRRVYTPDSLLQYRGPGFVQILDRRRRTGDAGTNGAREVILEDLSADVFVFCDVIRKEEEVYKEFAGRVSKPALVSTIEELVGQRLVYRSDRGRCVNLPFQKHRSRGASSTLIPEAWGSPQ